MEFTGSDKVHVDSVRVMTRASGSLSTLAPRSASARTNITFRQETDYPVIRPEHHERADSAFGQHSDPIFNGGGRFDSGNIGALGG